MEESLKRANQERRDAPADLEESASTSIDYNLKFTGWPNLNKLVAIAVATAVYTVFSWLSIVTIPNPTGIVSPIFIAIGFGIPFAIWFGGWAFVIAYIGNFVGAGLLSQLPILIAIPFGTTDLIQLGLPMILYRLLAKRFGVSPIGKDVFTPRGFIFFLLCAVIPNNLIGALYGNSILVANGIYPPSLFTANWVTWFITNVIVTIILGSVLLATLGPIVERFGLTVRNALR